ncbi:MAG: cytochrome c biogenesis protein CcdA, partial [Pirellulaceae bacterium]|nr:cytochrome c biogenesis protein CcdA [Pirellulaceae bacterium]
MRRNWLRTSGPSVSRLWLVAVCWWLSTAAGGLGQDLGFGFGQKLTPDQLVKLSAKLNPESGTQRGVLELSAVIAPRHHIYSTDQIEPGKPSIIEVPESPNYRVLGPFVADKKPYVKDPDPVMGFATESFKDKVIWRAALEFAPGVEVKDQTIELTYSGLVCEATGSCTPIDGRKVKSVIGEPIPAIDSSLIRDTAPPTPNVPEPLAEVPALGTETQFTDGFVTLTGRISHRSLKPGDSGSIFLSAEVIPGHHTYPNLPAGQTPDEPYMPTYMGVLSVAPGGPLSGFGFSAPVADQVPHDHVSTDGSVSVPALDGLITWEIKFQVPAELPNGLHRITGAIQFQSCDEFSCQPPISLAWQVPLEIGDSTIAEAAPAVVNVITPMAQKLLTDATAASKFLASIGTNPEATSVVESEAGKPVLDISKLQADVNFDPRTLSVPMVILVSLFGGFILNFMPCVLPVIGLKILSLVEQAGESRIQAIKFNGVYVLGMLSVFWVLAALIAFQQIAGWGSQFSSTLFTIVFSGVIFAMALSYLEVWEIVLPSAVGQHSAKLEQKEGLLGTFFKGGVTTILATPCSGPGLATALAWCA